MRAMYYYYKASTFTRIYYVPLLLILLASIEHAFRIFLSFFLFSKQEEIGVKRGTNLPI